MPEFNEEVRIVNISPQPGQGGFETYLGMDGVIQVLRGDLGVSLSFTPGYPGGRPHVAESNLSLGTKGLPGNLIVVDEAARRVFEFNGRNARLVVGAEGKPGDIALTGSDCAEAFDIAEEAEESEPGTVMVIGQEDKLRQSTQAYDKKVAGVISGAGDYRPGIILGASASKGQSLPLALTGKVYCKADAQEAPIEVGDLLTTSTTPGHAMKAVDPLKAFGAVIGKALRSLSEGQGLIPILIALQ